MSGEKASATRSALLRATGVVVILASAVAAILTAVSMSAPFHMEGPLALVLLTTLAISGVGGLWLLFATKNPWWALTFLPVVSVGAVWFLFSLMVPVTVH